MLCTVCNEIESKYKCSVCYTPYCSVMCWKNHKSQNICQPVAKVKEEPLKLLKVENKHFTEDTISPQKLIRLGENKEIRKMLKSKYLQQTLLTVENAKDSEKAVLEAMKDPNFVNFVDECLKEVEDTDN